jgi:DNA processing protein
MFPSRNRIVAALAVMTVVVEAGPRSGALITADWAARLGRPVGAVPGRVTTPQAIGPNELLAAGAQLVSGTRDVLDSIFGAGAHPAYVDERPDLDPERRAVLRAIEDGRDTPGALARDGVGLTQSLAALASLELAGYIRREAGGRFALVP